MKVLTVIIMGLLVSPALTAGGSGTVAVEFSLARKQETGVEPKPMSLAERYLFELALESKQARKWGYVYLGAGAALMAGGVAMVAEAREKDWWGEALMVSWGGVALTAAGGGAILGGINTLIVASGPERKYKVVNSLPDALHREQASREALFSLARSGRAKRHLTAGIFSGWAVLALIGTSEPEPALFPGAFAVYQFLRKSRAEKIYARFLEAGGVPPERINVSFGPGPRGGFRMVLTASF